LAALLFGASTPFVARFGRETGPFLTAGLLYLGASLGSAFGPRRREGPALQPAHWPRVLAVALVGAAFAPTCLAWGLQHLGATRASLLLNFEAVFTVALSVLLYREHVGRRIALAVALMVFGGVLLGGSAQSGGRAGLWGVLAILGATFGWALDNALTRPLADLDPLAVVRYKGLAGAILAALIGLSTRERVGAPAAVLGLLACGAAGYGLSLRFYLRAQRVIGAGRTGSIFAVAPFVGALGGWLSGDRAAGWTTLAAAALFALALYLHLHEKHEHAHTHETLEHEHSHRHDDGHHDHAHDPPVLGEHSHPHRHGTLTHSHPHALDVHHRHEH
jgi:drug/metabolite transporter (DMT)-like permease